MKQPDLAYYTTDYAPPELCAAGRATVKAFDVRSRFVHPEFFRLTQAKPGLGNVGDYVGLEEMYTARLEDAAATQEFIAFVQA